MCINAHCASVIESEVHAAWFKFMHEPALTDQRNGKKDRQKNACRNKQFTPNNFSYVHTAHRTYKPAPGTRLYCFYPYVCLCVRASVDECDMVECIVYRFISNALFC